MVSLVSGRHFGTKGMKRADALSKLVEIDLNGTGLDYVEQCLRQGTGLCSKLLQLPLSSGRAFAPVPQKTTLSRAKSFDVGGLMPPREAIDWLALNLRSLWGNDPEGTVVLQDIWAKPDDPVVRKSTANKFLTDQNVYYLLSKNHSDISAIEETLRSITSYLRLGIFTRAPLRHQQHSRAKLGQNIEHDLAERTAEIFVGAYDQEGFVIWRR
jgi:hypothetical protein